MTTISFLTPRERVYSGFTVRVLLDDGTGLWRWRLTDPGDDGTWSSVGHPTSDAAFEAARRSIEETDT